jgi:hypothetical protein
MSKAEGRASPPVPARYPLKRRVLREGAWILGCTAVATPFCWSEYGCAPMPFFAAAFYVLTGIIRIFLYWYVRWLSPRN